MYFYLSTEEVESYLGAQKKEADTLLQRFCEKKGGRKKLLAKAEKFRHIVEPEDLVQETCQSAHSKRSTIRSHTPGAFIVFWMQTMSNIAKNMTRDKFSKDQIRISITRKYIREHFDFLANYAIEAGEVKVDDARRFKGYYNGKNKPNMTAFLKLQLLPGETEQEGEQKLRRFDIVLRRIAKKIEYDNVRKEFVQKTIVEFPTQFGIEREEKILSILQDKDVSLPKEIDQKLFHRQIETFRSTYEKVHDLRDLTEAELFKFVEMLEEIVSKTNSSKKNGEE